MNATKGSPSTGLVVEKISEGLVVCVDGTRVLVPKEELPGENRGLQHKSFLRAQLGSSIPVIRLAPNARASQKYQGFVVYSWYMARDLLESDKLCALASKWSELGGGPCRVVNVNRTRGFAIMEAIGSGFTGLLHVYEMLGGRDFLRANKKRLKALQKGDVLQLQLAETPKVDHRDARIIFREMAGRQPFSA